MAATVTNIAGSTSKHPLLDELQEKGNLMLTMFDSLPAMFRMDGLDILQVVVNNVVKKITHGRVSAVRFVPIESSETGVATTSVDDSLAQNFPPQYSTVQLLHDNVMTVSIKQEPTDGNPNSEQTTPLQAIISRIESTPYDVTDIYTQPLTNQTTDVKQEPTTSNVQLLPVAAGKTNPRKRKKKGETDENMAAVPAKKKKPGKAKTAKPKKPPAKKKTEKTVAKKTQVKKANVKLTKTGKAPAKKTNPTKLQTTKIKPPKTKKPQGGKVQAKEAKTQGKGRVKGKKSSTGASTGKKATAAAVTPKTATAGRGGNRAETVTSKSSRNDVSVNDVIANKVIKKEKEETMPYEDCIIVTEEEKSFLKELSKKTIKLRTYDTEEDEDKKKEIMDKLFPPELRLQASPKKRGRNDVTALGVHIVKEFACNQCNYSTDKRSHLKAHMLRHNNVRRFQCPQCKQYFTAASSLKRHVMIHDGVKPFECPVCSKKFFDIASLRTHSVVHTGEKLFKCETCLKMYTNSANLRRHMRIHTGEMPYECKDCGVRFRDLASLKLHCLKHTGEKPYLCETCHKQFKTSSDFRRHERIHTGERHYKCKACNKMFIQGWHLKQHERMHADLRPWTCELCDKRLRTKASLHHHLRSHAGIKEYQCAICNKRFSTKKYLESHQVIHTKAKPYKCKTCGQDFNQMSNLKRHERIHSDVRNYKCKYCEKSFKYINSLQYHEGIHTGRKFTCEKCGMSFRSKHGIKHHTCSPTKLGDNKNFLDFMTSAALSDQDQEALDQLDITLNENDEQTDLSSHVTETDMNGTVQNEGESDLIPDVTQTAPDATYSDHISEVPKVKARRGRPPGSKGKKKGKKTKTVRKTSQVKNVSIVEESDLPADISDSEHQHIDTLKDPECSAVNSDTPTPDLVNSNNTTQDLQNATESELFPMIETDTGERHRWNTSREKEGVDLHSVTTMSSSSSSQQESCHSSTQSNSKTTLDETAQLSHPVSLGSDVIRQNSVTVSGMEIVKTEDVTSPTTNLSSVNNTDDDLGHLINYCAIDSNHQDSSITEGYSSQPNSTITPLAQSNSTVSDSNQTTQAGPKSSITMRDCSQPGPKSSITMSDCNELEGNVCHTSSDLALMRQAYNPKEEV